MKRTSAFWGLFSGYFKTDIRTVILLAFYATGVLLGALLIRFDVGFVADYAYSLATKLVFGISNFSFWQIFSAYVIYMLTAYFFSVMLGLFVPGELLSFAYVLFEGARTGAVYAVIYSSYGMKGALFSFSVMFLPTVIFAYANAFAFRGTVSFSLKLLMQFLGKKCDDLFFEYKSFLARSILFLVLILAASAVGSSLYVCFSGVFDFI